MTDHLTLVFEGHRVPVTKPARPRRWQRRHRRHHSGHVQEPAMAAPHPVVAMDAATQRWLSDLESLDSVLHLVSAVTDGTVRDALTESLLATARQVAPGGVTVQLASADRPTTS